MLKHSTMLALALLLFVPLSSADVGPSPPPPDVIVHLEKNGTAESGIQNITYHCMGSASADEGAVSQRLVDFDCVGGTCTNDHWFYKFNPCYDFPSGHFSYTYGGREISSDSFNNTEKRGRYEMTIDAPTGKITKKDAPEPLPYACWSSVLFIPLVLIGAIACRKR